MCHCEREKSTVKYTACCHRIISFIYQGSHVNAPAPCAAARLISDTNEVVGKPFNDGRALRSLERRDVLGNEDRLLGLDEHTAIGLYTDATKTGSARK